MYCVNEGRNLRNGSFSACWGNVCLYKGTEARSCGYFGNVSLCKKHHSEKTRANKQSCSFPFKSSTECAGTIVPCPQRLLSVFDRFPTTAKPGTCICLKHLTSADQDQEICAQKEYHPPRKVQSRSPCFFFLVTFFPLNGCVYDNDERSQFFFVHSVALKPVHGPNFRL